MYNRSTDPLWPFVRICLIFLGNSLGLSVITLILGMNHSKLWFILFAIFSAPIIVFFIMSMYYYILNFKRKGLP